MNEYLLNIVNNLGSPRVMLIGDFMLDSYVYGDALRISPEAPVPVLKVMNRESSCGGAASVAVDIEALGGKAICVGVIGEDGNGDELLKLLGQANADTEGLVRVEDRPTVMKQRLVGLAQHRHRQQLMRIDEECTEPLTDEQYDTLFEKFKEKLGEADVVCIQDYNKGLISEELCRKIIKESGKQNKKVLVDPPAVNDYSKFKGVDVITPNRQETSNVVGFEINSISDAKRAAEKLKKELKLEAAVVTLDRDGAYLLTDEISEHIPTEVRNVYDVTGAGDMVLATVATCLAAKCSYKDAVEMSNIAGSLEVEKFGVASVSIAEITHEIIARNKDNDSKIKPLDELKGRLEVHRNKNDKIIFTNGCFDVLHTGHISYLNFCKSQDGVVVVGLNSDASVRRLKGPSRPINNEKDRAIVLSALECVDYITVFEEDTPKELIEEVCPDVLIKGKDWADKGVVGREFVEGRGGEVVLAELVEGKSSTDTINKMSEQ